jgi:hypothetical protein
MTAEAPAVVARVLQKLQLQLHYAKGLKAQACARVHTWSPALASSLCWLQLKGSQCLSWLKEEAQRHGSSTANGKAKEAWGTEDHAGDGLVTHQHHECSPQLCLGEPPAPWQQ